MRGGLAPLDYDSVAASAIELDRGGEPAPFASLRSLASGRRGREFGAQPFIGRA